MKLTSGIVDLRFVRVDEPQYDISCDTHGQEEVEGRIIFSSGSVDDRAGYERSNEAGRFLTEAPSDAVIRVQADEIDSKGEGKWMIGLTPTVLNNAKNM